MIDIEDKVKELVLNSTDSEDKFLHMNYGTLHILHLSDGTKYYVVKSEVQYDSEIRDYKVKVSDYVVTENRDFSVATFLNMMKDIIENYSKDIGIPVEQ